MQTCPNCGASNSDEARFCQSCGHALVPAEAPAAAAARKVVTLVFCDLTGSTALGDKMDPESLRRIITRYFNEMRQVLIRHGGTVEKFIGDAVMAAFGVPMLHEDDALRAVRAAVEMQQAMDEMNLDLELEWGVGLKARIGVNTGEVITGDASEGHGFVSGDAVNVAARLEQAAPPGEVLIGEPTYRLVRDAVRVEPVEPLDLKGKPEKVPAYRLVEVIPHVLGVSRRLDSPIVGRERELELLMSVLEEAIAGGSCRLVTVFGAGGAGKSRLTAEFVARAEARVRLAWGRCLPYGEGITYWPVAEAIKDLCGIEESDSEATALEKLEAVVPPGDDAELVRARIASVLGLSEENPDTQEAFWAIRRALEAAADGRPLLFVLDDIHWGEQTLLDLIEYLASFAQGTPMLLLCLTRKDLLDVRPSWGSGSTTIHLEPLGDAEMSRLIDNLLGSARLPERARRRITEVAEGNPLYVEELLRMLIDDGVLQQEDGHWRPAGDLSQVLVPPTVQALIAARLDRLGSNEQAVTQRASVVGKTFWWGAVAELSPETMRPRVGHHLQALVRKELVLPHKSAFAGEDAFKFSHIMIRDAAYQGMPKELRAELHEAFATWLERKAGDRIREYEEILGYHLEQTFHLRQELGSVDESTQDLGVQAMERLASAGGRAFARGDMPAAANLLGRAARLLPVRDPRRLDLMLHLSDALLETGELDEAGRVIDQMLKVAQVIKDQRVAVRSSLQRCLLRSYSNEPQWKEEAIAAIDAAVPVLEAIGDHAGLARAHYLRALVHWDEYRMGAAEASLERALAHVQQGPKTHDLARILSFLSATVFWGPTPADKAIAVCQEIIEKGGGNRFVEATCLLRKAGLHAMRGELDEARSLVPRARAILGDLGQSLRVAFSAHEAGLIELLAEDYPAAAAEFGASFEPLEAAGERAVLATSAALLARALFEQGRLDEAEAATRKSEEAAGDDPAVKAEWGPTRARILAARGELDAAEDLAQAALEIASEPDDVLVRGHALEGLAAVVAVAGRGDQAAALLDEALRLYESKGVLPLIERVRAQRARLV